MKFLCLCNHGNVRSACMARELKDLGHEAIAIGITPSIPNNPWEGFSNETIQLLYKWADIVLDFSDNAGGRESILKKHKKYKKFHIGIDKWHNPFHPELRSIMQTIIQSLTYEVKDEN